MFTQCIIIVRGLLYAIPVLPFFVFNVGPFPIPPVSPDLWIIFFCIVLDFCIYSHITTRVVPSMCIICIPQCLLFLFLALIFLLFRFSLLWDSQKNANHFYMYWVDRLQVFFRPSFKEVHVYFLHCSIGSR